MEKASKTLIIDTAVLLSPFTGIVRYTYENSKLLKESNNYNLYFNYLYPSKELKRNQQKQNKTKSIRAFIVSNRLLKKYSRKLINSINLLFPKTYDIYWQPNIIPNPYIKAKKVVATVHDLYFLHFPQSHPKERIAHFRKNFKKEVSKCNHIITGSNYTKQEIINYLNFKEKEITVIYHGINHNLYKKYPIKEIEPTKQKFNLPNTFLLFAGSIEPRKNLLTLLKAFNMLDIPTQEKYPLFLIGSKGWKNQNIMQEIKKPKYIKYLGYIQDEELPHIYNLATIFIYPSLYEGFGLPPLEAFACGTPTIVSNTTSTPEICADAALYINPTNPNEIKEKIELLLKDKNLRKNLIEKALKRAKEFTWQRAVTNHIKVFDNL